MKMYRINGGIFTKFKSYLGLKINCQFCRISSRLILLLDNRMFLKYNLIKWVLVYMVYRWISNINLPFILMLQGQIDAGRHGCGWVYFGYLIVSQNL